MQILENKNNAETLNEIMTFNEFYNRRGEDFYFQIGKYIYRLHQWACGYKDEVNYTLEDITNAGKPGKECYTYRLNGDMNALRVLYEQNFDDVFFEIATNNLKNVTVYKGKKRAIDVFNPITIKETYKPLKEAPKKWTLTHAIRAIVNFQFEDLKCNGVYTDDYAWDNAVNFQRKQIENTAPFLQKIIESKSGWRVYDYDNEIHINCHTFDMNSFKFKIA